jgi:hypothetical protein
VKTILVAVAVGLSLPVWAQDVESRGGGDNGFKVGAGRLHPFIDLEARYDSNVLYYSGGKVGDLILHVRPGFSLRVPGSSMNVDLDALVDWNKYLGVNSDATNFSKLYLSADLGVAVNPGGRYGLELKDQFRRSDQTPSLSLATAVISDRNDLKVNVPMRPGGGALLLSVGGEWQMESFESFGTPGTCGTGSAPECSIFSYNQLSANGEARWLFLPRTAVVFDVDYFARMPKDTSVALEVSGLHTTIGLTGLVSPHVAATAKVGYGDTFGSAGPSYRTWLANAEVEYIASESASVRLGYLHTYAADAGGPEVSLYGISRTYADGKLLLAGQLTLQAQAEWDRIGYVLGSLDGASSDILRISPSVEVELVRWARLAAGYALTYRTAGDVLSAFTAYNFTKHETWLRLTLVY